MFYERQAHRPHHINKLHHLCLSHSLVVVNFKMLPIHPFYCQDFSSTIIELLFPINLKKTSISLQKYKVRVPQLLAELHPSTSEWKNPKKVVYELWNEDFWSTSEETVGIIPIPGCSIYGYSVHFDTLSDGEIYPLIFQLLCSPW